MSGKKRGRPGNGSRKCLQSDRIYSKRRFPARQLLFPTWCTTLYRWIWRWDPERNNSGGYVYPRNKICLEHREDTAVKQVHAPNLLSDHTRKIYAFRCTGQRHKPERYHRQKRHRPICRTYGGSRSGTYWRVQSYHRTSKRWTGCRLQTKASAYTLFPRRLYPARTPRLYVRRPYCIHPHHALWIRQRRKPQNLFHVGRMYQYRNSRKWICQYLPSMELAQNPRNNGSATGHDPNGRKRLADSGNFHFCRRGVRQYLRSVRLCLHGQLCRCEYRSQKSLVLFRQWSGVFRIRNQFYFIRTCIHHNQPVFAW